MTSERRGITTAAALLAAVLVIAGIAGTYFLGKEFLIDNDADALNVSDDNNDDSGTIKTGSTSLGTGDKIEIEVQHRDSLLNTALTEATHVQITQLGVNEEGELFLQGSGTDSIIELGPNDKGMVTVTFQEVSGQGYYLDVPELEKRNAKFEDVEFYDWDDDSDGEWVAKFNTNNMKTQEELDAIPILQIKAAWLDENTITLSAPANQASLGTSPTNVDIYWEATGTEGDATIWRRVHVEVNSTSAESEIDEGDSWVTLQYTDDRGNVKSTNLLFTEADNVVTTTTYTRWEWNVGEEFHDSPIYKFRQNESTKAYFTTRLDLDLATSDVRTVELGVSTWDAAETPNAIVEDTVQLSA